MIRKLSETFLRIEKVTEVCLQVEVELGKAKTKNTGFLRRQWNLERSMGALEPNPSGLTILPTVLDEVNTFIRLEDNFVLFALHELRPMRLLSSIV